MLPLSGVRIIAVESYGAGPFGSMYLADLGAEIIKVEDPTSGGDMSRGVGPHFIGQGDSLFFQTFNRSKKSLALNLKASEGQEILRRLAGRSDAVMNNLRGGLPEKLGLDYKRLKDVNEAIVCAHLSAYGRQGSRRDWPGYDYLMQAEAGFMSLTGEPDAPPARFGLSVVDYMTGVTLALGLCAAIIGARESGRGRDIDVSLFDVALHQLSYPATWYLNEGAVTERLPRSAHPSLAPSQLYRTADGWIVVMCQREKFWLQLLDALGRAELAERPEFTDHGQRCRNRDALTEILDQEFEQATTAEWLERLSGVVPVAPVSNLKQALDSDFAAERGMVEEVPHPQRPDLRTLASPFLIDGERPGASAGGRLGSHTREILEELGYDAGQIEALKAGKIVDTPADQPDPG